METHNLCGAGISLVRESLIPRHFPAYRHALIPPIDDPEFIVAMAKDQQETPVDAGGRMETDF
jgi:hypothetical protein